VIGIGALLLGRPSMILPGLRLPAFFRRRAERAPPGLPS